MKQLMAGVVLLAVSGIGQAVCYDLRDANGELLSSKPTPPYSLAWPDESADARAAKARGEHVVIRQGGCYSQYQVADGATKRGAAILTRELGNPVVPLDSPVVAGGHGGWHTIHTGPMGGRYYINGNGHKTYVKR